VSKFRKKLSILLVVALVLTLLTPAAFAADNEVGRIAGDDRYETSALIALDKFDSAETVIIVNGEDKFGFADGLAASVLAGALNAPILLTQSGKLPEAVADAIEELGASNVIILGGTTAVSEDVEGALEDLDLEVTRLQGESRIQTAVEIAKEAGTDSKTAYIVNGWANADAMVAGAAAFGNGNPILLVLTDEIPEETAQALQDLGIENIIIVGGEVVVSKDVAEELDKDYNVKRIAGAKRAETSAAFAEDQFDNPSGVSIVNGYSLADAVGASVYGNPILYASHTGNDINAVEDYLDVLLADNPNLNIVLFGGTKVLSNSLQNDLQDKLDDSELVVKSVSGITKAVNSNANYQQQLSLAINGQSEATDVQDLINAGYSVEFIATEEVFSGLNKTKSNTGVLSNAALQALINAAPPVDYFEYQVIVYKDGEEVAKSELQEVEIVEGETLNILSLKVFKVVGTDRIEVKSGKLTNHSGTTYDLQVWGSEAQSPDNFEDLFDNPVARSAFSVKSSNPAIATVDQDNGDIIFNGGTGSVTFTVETAAGNSKSITFDVTTGALEVDPKQSSVENTTLKTAAGITTYFVVTLKDKFGDPVPGEALSLSIAEDVTNTAGDDLVLESDVTFVESATKGTYVATVPTQNAAGKGTMEVVWNDGTEDKSIGTLNVDITTTPGAVNKYVLEPANKAEKTTLDARKGEKTELAFRLLDRNSYKIKDDTEPDFTNDYTVYVDGKKISEPNDYVDVQITANNTIEITAKRAKSSSVTIQVREGEFVRASQNITVNDSRVEITDVSFESDIPAIETEDGIALSEVLQLSGLKTNATSSQAISFKTTTSGEYLEIVDSNNILIGVVKLTGVGDITNPVFADGTYSNGFDHRITPNTNSGRGAILVQVAKVVNTALANDVIAGNDTWPKGFVTLDTIEIEVKRLD